MILKMIKSNLGWKVEKLVLLSLVIMNYFNFSIQQTLILQVKDDNNIVKEARFFLKKKKHGSLMLWGNYCYC